jgi:hypothetical protein
MSSNLQPILDHIVILVPSQVLENLPAWLVNHLAVLPGGQHADGLTKNKLIIFEDGVYIELIAFVDGIDPEKRNGHRWGCRSEGQIVDWAFTLVPQGPADPEEQFPAIQARVRDAHAGFIYSDLVPGGRTTPDGIKLRWAVSAPQSANNDDGSTLEGGELPFWCLDRTPRRLRVPFDNPKNVQHPCGAVGLGAVEVLVKGASKANDLHKVYDAVCEDPARMVAVAPAASGYSWKLRAPAQRGTAEAKLVVRSWDDEAVNARDAASEDVHVNISLFTRGVAGRIEGEIGRGRQLIVDLIPLSSVNLDSGF